jgi:metallo-beta-lactamase class B
MRKALLSVLALAPALAPIVAVAQPAGWNNPFPPHKIMDNFYFVGTEQLASFLIVTPQGNILMNSNYESSVPVIQAAVEKLGFNFKDIKILIAGHAHPDHVEGDALVKQLTGAQVVVGRLEVEDTKAFKPGGKEHPIDRIIDDGDTVSLGGTTLTAHVMPGHTKGCLAWTMDLHENGKTYKGFIECSLNGQFLQYINNKDYPTIEQDMRSTYVKALTFTPDVWMSSHTVFYNLAEKYKKLQAMKPGDPNPFIDPEGYKAHVEEYRKTFEAAVANQKAGGNTKGGRGGGRGGRGGATPTATPTQQQ